MNLCLWAFLEISFASGCPMRFNSGVIPFCVAVMCDAQEINPQLHTSQYSGVIIALYVELECKQNHYTARHEAFIFHWEIDTDPS